MTATFDTWEASARSALAERGIGYHEATPLIADARAHYERSGKDVLRALGSPQQFAADVADDRPAAQDRLDTRGKTARDYLSDAVFALAFLGIPAAILGAWAAGGLAIPVTVAGLTGVVLAGLSMIVGHAAPGALRASGHPRLAPWGFVLCGVLVVAAGAAFTQLPRTRLGEVPALGLLAVSLLLCWLLTRPDRAPERSQPSPDDADSPEPPDAEAWFTRLQALLVGRFDVPVKRATALVDEARAHVAATGTAPHDEFPAVARYARELAEGEPVRQGPWWRSTTAGLLVRVAIPVLLLPAVVQFFLDGRGWIAAAGVAIVVWLAWEPLRSAQALVRHRRSTTDKGSGANPAGRRAG